MNFIKKKVESQNKFLEKEEINEYKKYKMI